MNKLLIVAIVIFLATRLYNLTLLPIFTDESVYIYWAKYIATYHTNWFISLTDGNPPLFTWMATFLLEIFPKDMYLFAGRLISVIAGGIGLIGIYKLSTFLFRDKKTCFFAVLLYIINPFLLFYDRLALYDGLLSAMLVWSVYYTVKTSKTLAKKHALLWGIFLGLGLLAKSSAVIFLILTPLCFILLLSIEEIKSNVKKIVLLPFFAVTIAWILNSAQIVSPLYQSIATKTQQFQIPLNTLLFRPFAVFGSNIPEICNWLLSYYTFPVFFIGCVGLLFLLKKDTIKGSVLLLLWIVPILGFALIGNILFPRYILFTTPYFLIILAQALSFLGSKKGLRFVQIGIISIIVFFSVQFDLLILTNPSHAPFPTTDYRQYISDRNSGYGLNDIFAYLDKEVSNGPQIALITQGKFGLFPYAFILHFWNNKRVFIIPSLIPQKNDVNFAGLEKTYKVYVVFWEYETILKTLPLRLVLRAEKPGGEHSILLAAPK